MGRGERCPVLTPTDVIDAVGGAPAAVQPVAHLQAGADQTVERLGRLLHPHVQGADTQEAVVLVGCHTRRHRRHWSGGPNSDSLMEGGG